jgi:galactokinase
VNLIGDHTDYQGGLVFPLALRRGTRFELRPRADDLVRLFSANLPDAGLRTYRLGEEHRAGDWDDYVRGVTAELRMAGYAIGGFDALVTSDLPVGSGLSSSAALEVAALRALRRAFDLALDDKSIAHLARRAETELVGVPVGVMDQIACSVGDPTHALFLDTRSLAFERVAIPPSLQFLVIDSAIPHRNAETGYRQRRHEAEQAADELGVPTLRDVTIEDLARVTCLPPPLGRRVRHVVTENARVAAFRAALDRQDEHELGMLLAQSHRSLRDDYQVSLPEIDLLVDLCCVTPGVLGARLTGGGFGGSVVVLALADAARAAAAQIAGAYASRTGRQATALLGRGADATPAP